MSFEHGHRTDGDGATLRIGDDLLTGTREIANELGWPVRKVQFAIAKRRIPFFKVGALIHARRSALRAHFEQLEREQQGADE
jgi:excisionase family DNA binding protein